MEGQRPARLRRWSSVAAFRHLGERLVTSSLLLYLVAVLAHRTWVILNSDVGQLIKRLH